MKPVLVIACVAGIALFIASRFVSIFIVQPIGALPQGRTVIITRLENMNFIDSADAWCDRNMGGVNLLCRGAVIARVGNQAKVVLSLPYSSTLYDFSTGGKRYDR